MRIKRILFLISIALISGCATTLPDANKFLLGETVTPPKGALIYRGPLPKPKIKGEYSLERVRYISKVLHGRHRYFPESFEDWRPSLKGDCDSYATYVYLAMRHEGIPARLVYAKSSKGEYHLVNEVDGWIIDNVTPWVYPKQSLNYKWISVGGLEEEWRAVVN